MSKYVDIVFAVSLHDQYVPEQLLWYCTIVTWSFRSFQDNFDWTVFHNDFRSSLESIVRVVNPSWWQTPLQAFLSPLSRLQGASISYWKDRVSLEDPFKPLLAKLMHTSVQPVTSTFLHYIAFDQSEHLAARKLLKYHIQ